MSTSSTNIYRLHPLYNIFRYNDFHYKWKVLLYQNWAGISSHLFSSISHTFLVKTELIYLLSELVKKIKEQEIRKTKLDLCLTEETENSHPKTNCKPQRMDQFYFSYKYVKL